jgi:hypothetical protein
MTAVELADESPGEGRQAILTALRELRETGYIVQTRHQGEGGRWRTETVVYDTPRESTEVRLPDPGSTEVRSPDVGSPDVGGPDAGQPDRIRRTTEKKQENKYKNNQHHPQRERGEAPTEGGKPLSLSGRGGNSVGVDQDRHGISLQAGNQRDLDALQRIEQHGRAEIAAAVTAARARDPQGRAWPTAVLRLLLQARTAASTSKQDVPAWARLFPTPAVPAQAERREIDITDMEYDT